MITQHTTTFPSYSFILFEPFPILSVSPSVYCTVSVLSLVVTLFPPCSSLPLSGVNGVWLSEIFSSLCESRAVSKSADLHLYQNPPPSARPAALSVLQSCTAYLRGSPNSPDSLPTASANTRAWQTAAAPVSLTVFPAFKVVEGKNLCTWPKLVAISCHSCIVLPLCAKWVTFTD